MPIQNLFLFYIANIFYTANVVVLNFHVVGSTGFSYAKNVSQRNGMYKRQLTR